MICVFNWTICITLLLYVNSFNFVFWSCLFNAVPIKGSHVGLQKRKAWNFIQSLRTMQTVNSQNWLNSQNKHPKISHWQHIDSEIYNDTQASGYIPNYIDHWVHSTLAIKSTTFVFTLLSCWALVSSLLLFWTFCLVRTFADSTTGLSFLLFVVSILNNADVFLHDVGCVFTCIDYFTCVACQLTHQLFITTLSKKSCHGCCVHSMISSLPN